MQQKSQHQLDNSIITIQQWLNPLLISRKQNARKTMEKKITIQPYSTTWFPEENSHQLHQPLDFLEKKHVINHHISFSPVINHHISWLHPPLDFLQKKCHESPRNFHGNSLAGHRPWTWPAPAEASPRRVAPAPRCGSAPGARQHWMVWVSSKA